MVSPGGEDRGADIWFSWVPLAGIMIPGAWLVSVLVPRPADSVPAIARQELRPVSGATVPETPPVLTVSNPPQATTPMVSDHQLIHRDIKPANIIFVQGTPKLADIGLVTTVAEKPNDVSYLGTKGYLSPEGPGTPSSDLYGLGKVLSWACGDEGSAAGWMRSVHWVREGNRAGVPSPGWKCSFPFMAVLVCMTWKRNRQWDLLRFSFEAIPRCVLGWPRGATCPLPSRCVPNA